MPKINLASCAAFNMKSEDSHPAMLAAAAGPKGRLILVGREQSVPDQAAGQERWSLDHLFLGVDGLPVLVDVKRASDAFL